MASVNAGLFKSLQCAFGDAASDWLQACAGAAAEVAMLRATYDYTLACLRSFARRYYRAVAAVADEVEANIYAGDDVPEEIRTAVLEGMHV